MPHTPSSMRVRGALRQALFVTLVSACSTPGGAVDARGDDASAVDDALRPLDGATDDAARPGPDSETAPAIPEATRCVLEAPVLENARLRVDGTALRDALGRQVLLRGVNLGGRSKLPPFLPFESESQAEFDAKLALLVDRAASWGLDVVRLPFSWEAFEPTRGTYDDAWFARYRAIIDAAWQRRIRVLVDFHQDVYARVYCGDGFPAWTLGTLPAPAPHADCRRWFEPYFSPTSDVSRAFDRLWRNDDQIADAMERMWTAMATRTASLPGVFAYEVLNEPGTGSLSRDVFLHGTLPAFTTRMATAIRRVAPDALIVEGGPAQSSTGEAGDIRAPAIEGFVYAPHYYDSFATLGVRYANTAVTRASVSAFADRGARMNAPVLLGEFGTSYEAPNGARFLRDVLDALDARLAHGTAWELSLSAVEWNFERLGLVAPDGAERPAAAELVRGYPRAVDGTLRSVVWNAVAHTLDVEISGAREGITEVFVPTRYLGTNPRVGLSAGCAHFDADTQTLRVRASGAVRISVRPRA